jgi:uncharacterized membrane protein YhaH (DUF805 family)
MKRLRWEAPTEQRPLPKHPYRDTALVYGGMSAFVVLLAALTGGDVGQAIVIAVFVFLVATLWTWRHWRNRLRVRQMHDRKELL